VATVLSPPDAEGFLSFGSHGAAIYSPFVEACRDPNRLAIAEINPRMPRVYGAPEYGDNKIHISEIDAAYEGEQAPLAAPEIAASEVEQQIAQHVMELIDDGATLQFGIGGVPDQVATLLAESSLSDFGVHSEMIADGFLKLVSARKISNKKKGQFEGQTVFTFAFGSQVLYDFLDERKGLNNRKIICLPVSIVNDPSVIARNRRMISINSALMVDFAGQICSEAIGVRQYSGIGGQLSFVEGAYAAEGGKSILCLKSTAEADGKRLSNIRPLIPAGSVVSTPRHYTQYVVTEYGIADLYGVSDEKRPQKLIAIAHPDFRDELTAEYEQLKRDVYKE
jgi:acyl-CoA hydrolase